MATKKTILNPEELQQSLVELYEKEISELEQKIQLRREAIQTITRLHSPVITSVNNQQSAKPVGYEVSSLSSPATLQTPPERWEDRLHLLIKDFPNGFTAQQLVEEYSRRYSTKGETNLLNTVYVTLRKYFLKKGLLEVSKVQNVNFYTFATDKRKAMKSFEKIKRQRGPNSSPLPSLVQEFFEQGEDKTWVAVDELTGWTEKELKRRKINHSIVDVPHATKSVLRRLSEKGMIDETKVDGAKMVRLIGEFSKKK